MPNQPLQHRTQRNFADWIITRLENPYRYDTRFWRMASLGAWITSWLISTLMAMGLPTGFGFGFDVVLYVCIMSAGMLVSGGIAAYAIALIGLRIPRLYLGHWLFTGIATFLFFYNADMDVSIAVSYIAALLEMFLGLTAGLWLGAITGKRTGMRTKVILGLLAVFAAGSAAHWLPFWKSRQTEYPSLKGTVAALSASDPADPGSFPYKTFTYGSGHDRQQLEFGADADLLSDSADASAFFEDDDDWNGLRTFYWGFDESDLPINGRVWMPEGVGPFPLVLIVHGNHLMEDFSDKGYAYMGELLASRGFIAVSVDENFLNYSVWSGIPDEDMELRAWILLQHLEQIGRFNAQPDNPFSNKVDLNRVALVGHSRGGQAVAIAGDYSSWFEDDPSLSGMTNIHIRAVAALAPTDFVVDHKSAELHDIDYMTLEGARDGDVNDFYGMNQYERTTFSAGSDQFKTSLYIANANHSQFNTTWGPDESMPGGFFLTRQGIMPGDEQRKIAKVYVSAFLETALHGSSEYMPMFEDYRKGLDWLPDSGYFNRYEDGSFREIARYDSGSNPAKPNTGVEASANGMTDWPIKQMEDREHNAKGTSGQVLEWQTSGSSYTLSLGNSYREAGSLNDNGKLVFSMADLERDISKSRDTGRYLPEVEVELESAEGDAVRLPLSDSMPVLPLPYTTYTWIPWMEDHLYNGKYREAVEPVFQTYQLSFERFRTADPQFPFKQLKCITFYFVNPKGKVILDDVGIMQ